MPETMSIERRNLLKALGAEIVLTDGLAGMTLYRQGAGTEGQDTRRVILQQFENPSTPGYTNLLRARKSGRIRTDKWTCLWRE